MFGNEGTDKPIPFDPMDFAPEESEPFLIDSHRCVPAERATL